MDECKLCEGSGEVEVVNENETYPCHLCVAVDMGVRMEQAVVAEREACAAHN